MRLLDIATVPLSSENKAVAFWTWLKWAAAAVGSFAFGAGPRQLLGLYVTFIFWDFLTGVFASWLTGKVSSKISFKGILKKCMGLAAVGFAHAVDLFLSTTQQGGAPGMVQGIVTKLLIGYEFISIAENLAAAGIVLPKSLTDLMARVTSPPVIPGTKVVVETTKTEEHAVVSTTTLTPVPPPARGEKGDTGPMGPQGPPGGTI